MLSFVYYLAAFIRALKSLLKDVEFKALLFFVVIILTTGTFFYSQVEKWSLFDSLYFSVTTLTTVGYGDLTPKTVLGKSFTILYIFMGLGTIFGFVDAIARHASKENPIKRFLSRETVDEPKTEKNLEEI